MKPGRPPRIFIPACEGYFAFVEDWDLNIEARKAVSASVINLITSSGILSHAFMSKCWHAIQGFVLRCGINLRTLIYFGQFLSRH